MVRGQGQLQGVLEYSWWVKMKRAGNAWHLRPVVVVVVVVGGCDWVEVYGLIPELDTSLVTGAGLNQAFGAKRLLVIIQEEGQSRPTGRESLQVR